MTGSLILLCFSDGLIPNPSDGAEQVTITYGPVGRSVSVADLRQYAETSEASPELASLLSIVKPKQRSSLQRSLTVKLPVSVIQMDQLLRSESGTQVLTQLAQATVLPGDSEELALRSALIVSAASEEGLSAIVFLEAYPISTLTINAKVMQKLLQADSPLSSLLGELSNWVN